MHEKFDLIKFGSQLSLQEKGIDCESKDTLIRILESDDEASKLCQPEAAVMLHGLITESEVPLLEKFYNQNDSELFSSLFCTIAGTLEESGQEYYLNKLNDRKFPFKHLVFYAIQKYGDERFVEPSLKYLDEEIANRATEEEIRAYLQGRSKKKVKGEITYLRNLSDILSIVMYLKRIDNDAFNKALEVIKDNPEKIDDREKQWLNANLNIAV